MSPPRIRRRPTLAPEAALRAARWLPMLVPLGLGGLHLVFPRMAPALPMILAGGAIAWSAEQWRRRNVGLSLLVPLQLGAGLLSVLLGLGDASQPALWLRQCGWVTMMVGYTSFLFNLVATLLPP